MTLSDRLRLQPKSTTSNKCMYYVLDRTVADGNDNYDHFTDYS